MRYSNLNHNLATSCIIILTVILLSFFTTMSSSCSSGKPIASVGTRNDSDSNPSDNAKKPLPNSGSNPSDNNGNDPNDEASDDGNSSGQEDLGTDIGTFEWTYYWIVFDGDYSGGKTSTLYLEDGTELHVTDDFANRVKTEGTGYLDDAEKTLINLGEPCSHSSDGKCFSIVNKTQFPYGIGSYDNPLHPWRSIAADLSASGLSNGQKLYIPQLDGVEMPQVEDIVFDPSSEGFKWDDSCECYRHDGCVVVEDEGVTGMHLDFFALTKPAYHTIDLNMGEIESISVYANSPKCP